MENKINNIYSNLNTYTERLNKFLNISIEQPSHSKDIIDLKVEKNKIQNYNESDHRALFYENKTGA